jgi:protein-disulfide isomerase-like protein with CxxC motif
MTEKEKIIVEYLNGQDKVLVEVYSTIENKEQNEILKPEILEASRMLDNQVSIRSVDAGDIRELVSAWGISRFPTLLFFKRGKLEWKHEGLIMFDQLIQNLQSEE